MIRDGNTQVAAESSLYGVISSQFAVQSLMYTKYYNSGITLELSLSQGGNVYSFTPVVEFVNPSG